MDMDSKDMSGKSLTAVHAVHLLWHRKGVERLEVQHDCDTPSPSLGERNTDSGYGDL